MNPDPIQIRVLREAGMWRVQFQGVVLEYESHDRALAASIELAHTLGCEGQRVAVVMRMITSFYGPAGFIQTVPNRKKSDSKAFTSKMPMQPLIESLPEIEGTSLVPEVSPEPLDRPAELPRRKLAEEKEPRLLRIASALAAVDKA